MTYFAERGCMTNLYHFDFTDGERLSRKYQKMEQVRFIKGLGCVLISSALAAFTHFA